MIYDRLSLPWRIVAVVVLAIAAPLLIALGHTQQKLFVMVTGEIAGIYAIIGAVPIVRNRFFPSQKAS